MPTEPTRIYWDSCCYLYCIQQCPKRFGDLRAILKLAETGEVIFVASTMVVAEVVKLKDSSESIRRQAQKIQDFFENDYIRLRAVTRDIAEKAADYCRTYGLKPPDAIHVATAIDAHCECLQTYDGEEKRKKHHLLQFDGKIGVPPLPIKLPTAFKRQLQKEIPLPVDDPDAK